MRRKHHVRPYTEKERIEAGQHHYEFRDDGGVLLFDCWRANKECARKAFRSAMASMVKQKKRHEQAKREMRRILSARSAEIEKEQRRRLIDQGYVNLNQMTFFDY